MENFDKKLKDKINKYNSSVDPEMIWQGIQQKRNRGKKRIIPIFWIAAILILLIGIPVVFNLENIFNRKNTMQELAKNNKDKNSDNKKFDKESEIKSTVNNSSSNDIDFNIKINNSKLHNNKNININSKASKDNKNIINSKNEISDHYYPKNNNSILETSNEILVNNNTQGADSYEKIIADYNLSKINMPLNQIKKTSSELNLTPKIFETIEKKKTDRKSNQICYAITPQYAFRQIKAADETSFAYAKNVQHNEKYLESFDINLLFKKPVNRSLYIASGLNYSQTDRKLDYTYLSSETYVDDNVLSRMVSNMPGDTIKYFSQKTVSASYAIREKIYNYNRKINIPVIIGYYRKLGKMNFEFCTGIDLALFDLSKGKMITPEGKTIDIKDLNNNLLRKRVLQNLRLSFTLQKRFSEKLFLDIGPEFKYGFNQYADSSGLKINDNSIGFKTSIRYKF